MKINHYNTYPHGGAANAAKRIHNGLCEQAVDSRFYYRIDDQQADQVRNDSSLIAIEYDSSRKATNERDSKRFDLWRPLQRQIQKRREKRRVREIHRLYDSHIRHRGGSEHEVYSMARLPEPTRLDWNGQQQSDIVHLHWLAHMVDFPSFFDSIPNSVPIVWTMHDMGAFTGGCHYSNGCQQFQSGCGNCPQVAQPLPRDVSFDSMQAKRKSLADKQIHVVAPSRWLIELAKNSPVWPSGTTFSVIHYGLDLQQFYPQDQALARHQMGIETDKMVLGFGADDLLNPRKGFEFLQSALQQLASTASSTSSGEVPIELVVFGEGEISQELQSQYRTHSFGFVREPERLAMIYACCDMVCVPSLQDNQPQVGLEAMACGRPVIGFDAGGIPEYVVDGKTGRVVPARDTAGLAESIVWMAQHPEVVREFGICARQKMEVEFEIVAQTGAYIELYRKLMADTSLGAWRNAS